ncbi:hypothetical protein [Roseomonas marmotae]|uniref:DUF4148 domain-containing protein n=1 Tax=Roseomonas marmotae TaxID=2768161 RepID=A0ABS3KBW3_9PROT|nr:hypothetical protein [Roseomonas marmotae]MBO1074968.1 hypothetical protein [Roseomonas marmotae]QTI79991.1 hypothetical protein IAI58_04215 [Roseomonas marmotae]
MSKYIAPQIKLIPMRKPLRRANLIRPYAQEGASKMRLRILMSGLTFMAAGLAFGTPAAQAAQSVPGISSQGPSDIEYVQQRSRRNRNLQNPNSPGWDNDMTARLNEESLRRAQQGQNALTNQPDTTSNLNRMSESDAERGVNVGSQPLIPFR